jgi:hypothetical protein
MPMILISYFIYNFDVDFYFDVNIKSNRSNLYDYSITLYPSSTLPRTNQNYCHMKKHHRDPLWARTHYPWVERQTLLSKLCQCMYENLQLTPYCGIYLRYTCMNTSPFIFQHMMYFSRTIKAYNGYIKLFPF